MKLYYYNVKLELRPDRIHMANEIDSALSALRTVEDRLMYLDENESKDVDFIADWHLDSRLNMLVCSLIRLRKDIHTILKTEDLKNEKIDISQIVEQSSMDNAGSIKSTVFFGISDKGLIINNKSSKVVYNYIRWLFANASIPVYFSIEPVIDSATSINLARIKKIYVGENINMEERNCSKMKQMIIDCKKNAIKSFIDVDDFCEYEDLVSASLILKFDKRKVKSSDAASQIMTLVDDDNVCIETHDGKKYKGSELRKFVNESIELTSEGVFNWVDVQSVIFGLLRELL